MRKGILTLCILIFFMFWGCEGKASKEGAKTEGEKGAYYTGIYQNLFVDLLWKSEQEVQARIDQTFQQLFYGADDDQRIYYPVEPDMAYMFDVASNDVRTEGQSYGMMIAVQMDKKEEFDRIWKWTKTYMQHQDDPAKGYFAWHCKTDGSQLAWNSAADGEEWFAMTLFFAAARWGNGEGIYNYVAEAQAILDACLSKTESSNDPKIVTNLFNKEHKQIVFVPTGRGDDFTDPSYHTPHYYELWARWADKENAFWCDVADTSRELLKRAAQPETGLYPDYSTFAGKPIGFGGHQDFRYDAWRVAMNIALDWQWFARDPWAIEQSNRWLTFFDDQGITTHGSLFKLDGEMIAEDHSAGLVAMNAVACLAGTHEKRKEFVQEFWDTETPDGHYRYYDGVLYLMGQLQAAGQFRIWDPTGTPVEACVD